MERLNRHLSRLCVITLIVLFGVVTLARYHVVFDKPTILLRVMCFGALGAVMSMMTSIVPRAGTIPSQLATGTLLFARPLFGASAAVAVYMFLKMRVLNVPYENTGEFAYFGLAFAAGFSDQLLLSAVSKVAMSSSESIKGKDHRQA